MTHHMSERRADRDGKPSSEGWETASISISGGGSRKEDHTASGGDLVHAEPPYDSYWAIHQDLSPSYSSESDVELETTMLDLDESRPQMAWERDYVSKRAAIDSHPSSRLSKYGWFLRWLKGVVVFGRGRTMSGACRLWRGGNRRSVVEAGTPK